MLIVLFLILTGCQTVPPSEPIEIPSFSVPAPSRPTLEAIPSDMQGAIKALITNMNKLVRHIEKWELHNDSRENYFKSIVQTII